MSLTEQGEEMREHAPTVLPAIGDAMAWPPQDFEDVKRILRRLTKNVAR